MESLVHISWTMDSQYSLQKSSHLARKDMQTTYAPKVDPLPAGQTRRSCTPYYPYGKWWFYERILQVPSYFIFWPELSRLESYQLSNGRYKH